MRETKASAGRDNPATDTKRTATEASPTQARPNRIIEHMRTGDFFHQAVYASLYKKLFDRKCEVRVGKYKLVRSLGAGGMGEVFVCEDPDLGREIALKRVHAGGGAREQARLRREARALARLRDDNIVTVYDCVEHEGSSFVAMELLEQNLDRWLETPRASSDILERLIEAGHGLAAVHEANLVHRDFKPQNVLVDHRGRAKVADFGLVLDQSLTEDFTDASADASAQHQDERLGDARLSSTGAFLGTPRYMAPEQLRGGQASARSDQFAFCLVAYEALWHDSPFANGRDRSDATTTIRERIERIGGRGPSPPRRHRELFAVIRKGLQPDPNMRWASMRDLLEQLTRARDAPRRRRQRRAWFAGASAGIAAIGLAVWFGGHGDQQPSWTCDASLDGVWDEDLRAGLRAHAAKFPVAHSEDSGARVIATLDEWAETWAPAHARTCKERLGETDPLRAQQSTARGECLLHQAQTVSELVDTVLIGDAKDLAQAVLAVEALPAPADCETELAGLGVAPPPAGLRELVAATRAVLDEAKALRLLGRWDAAIARAQAVEIAARALGYAPLLAEAQAQLAMALDEGGDPKRAAELYAAAIETAVITHHDRLTAALYIEQTELALRTRDPNAAQLLNQAKLHNKRVGMTDEARARSEFAEGRLAAAAGDHARAAKHYRSAIKLGAERSALSSYLGALAGVTEDKQEAVELRHRALNAAIEHFGPHHPRTAIQHFNYGAALPLDSEQRAREFAAAAEIWDETLPPAHPLRAQLEHVQAIDALNADRLDDAEDHANAMAAILRRLYGEDAPALGEPEILLANIAAMRADGAKPDASPSLRRAAIDHAERALRSLLADPSPLADQIANTQLLLGNQQMMLGELDAAERSFRAALERAPSNERVVALSRLYRAELAVRHGHFEEAAVLLDAISDGALAKLRRAEGAVREGHFEAVAAILDSIPDMLADTAHDRRTRKVLLAFVNHRLARPIDALDLPPESIPSFRNWLEQLGASKATLHELGLYHAN